MHLRLEDFETYLSTDDISQESLAAIEPIQLHLDSCEHCRKTLSQLSIVYHTIADENLGSSALLLNHEQIVRRGLVFTVLYKELYAALPQEQERLRNLIADFTANRYYTYSINQLEIIRNEPPILDFSEAIEPEPIGPEPDEAELLNTLDYAALRGRLKEPPFGSSGGSLSSAANIMSPFSRESYSSHYDGKDLIISVSRQSPVSHMILKPKRGLELPQLQPAVYDQRRHCYKAVFPLGASTDAYQVLIF